MTNISLGSGATAVLLILGGVSAQNLPSWDNMPPVLQSTTPDKSPKATVPEVATDVAGIPRKETSGQAPIVSKRMGAEMDSAGDQRALPDEQ
jgi:hypothetical protein